MPFADAMCLPLPSGLDPVAGASLGDYFPDGYRAVAPGLADHSGARSVDLLATTDSRPDLVTHTTARWDDAAEVLGAHTHKTVICR